jgi:cell division protein FtsL
MKVRGRHWLILWLVLFLGVAAAVVSRQRAALLTARTLANLRSERASLEGEQTRLERQIEEATSRTILIPKMERIGFHQPDDQETTILKAASPTPGARPDH